MLQIGTVLEDRFLIEKQLAQGGMGAVYLATDQKFGSRVAIKERFYEHAELAEAFAREARILNSLHHPILPHVSDYFSGPDGHFLVMEYIEGDDLSEIVKRDGAFPAADVIRWAMELLDTLDYLHSQDPPIIHRDIKPGNLKLTSRGNIVLLDFGLAKETSGNTQGSRSIFGYSRRYSPLEQIEGAGTDQRSDIFSLGATLFHLMTGEPPVDALARASAIIAGRPDPLISADQLNHDVDPAFARVLTQALSMDRDKRFAMASAMKSAIESVLSGNADSVLIENVEPVIFDLAAEETAGDGIALNALPTGDGRDDEVIKIDDTEEPRSAVASVRPQAERSSRRISWAGSTVPIVQRPALWVAVLILALLVMGIAGVKLSNKNSTINQPVVDQAAEQPVSVAPAVEPSPDEAVTAQSNDAELVSDVADDKPVQREVALEKKNAERPEKQVNKADEEPAPTNKSSRKAPSQMREPRPREVAVDRQPVIQQLPERPRFVHRRQPVYGPPASSIETIFTGIPPEHRYRWRRIY